MPLDFVFERFRSTKRDLFTKFVTEAVSETAKVAIAVTASVAHPILGPVVSHVAGQMSKQFIETLLKRASEVERKLDILLFEPLVTGLQLLLEGYAHAASTSEELASRDKILDASHVSFLRAHSLIVTSREDSVFVRALDCLALAGHRGRMTLAAGALAQIDSDLLLLHQHVEGLESNAMAWMNDVNALNKFLGRGDYGAKPFGYADQVAVAKRYERKAKTLDAEAREARHRLSLLDNMAAVARKSVAR